MKKKTKLLLGIPLALIGLGAIAGFVISFNADKKYEEDLARLRQLGVPTDPKEMAALDTGDPATGEMYQAAITRFHSLGGKTALADVAGRWSKATPVKTTRDIRAAFADLYPVLEEVAARPTVSFERDWKQGMNVMFPEYADMTTFAKIMSGEAKIRASEHDLDGTIIALETLDGFAAHCASEPTLIGSLVAGSIEKMHGSATAFALEEFQNDPAALNALEKHLLHLRKLPPLTYALKGEVYFGRSFFISKIPFRQVSSMSGNTSPQAAEFVADLRPIRKAVERKFIATWRDLFDHWPKDELDFDGQDKAFADMEKKISEDKSLTGSLNNLFFPVFSQAAQTWRDRLALERVCLLSTKLLLEREKTGALPASIASYGDLAMDPHSKGPLHYVRTATEFRVYSVGGNRKDDGGQRGKSSKDDIGVVIHLALK